MRVAAWVVLSLGPFGCTPAVSDVDEPVSVESDSGMADIPDEFAAVGWLPAQIVRLRAPDSNTLIVYSKLTNPYERAIEGIRIYVGLRAAGEDRRMLAWMEREDARSISPGATVPLRIEFATAHAKLMHGVDFHAFAMRRGGETLPPPPELEGSATTAVSHVVPSVPYPSTPVNATAGINF